MTLKTQTAMDRLRLLARSYTVGADVQWAIAEIERLRHLLVEVHNHGETSDLHLRIAQALGGTDESGFVRAEPQDGDKA